MEEDPKITQTDKINEYIKKHEEIFDFIIHRKVWKSLMLYISIFLAILTLVGIFGGRYYINSRVDKGIIQTLSDKTNEEYSYLSKRNEITELGDLTISTGKTEYYEKIKTNLNLEEQKRIYNAAKAELMRVDSFFYVDADNFSFSELRRLVYTSPDKKVIKGFDIPAEGLIEIFHKAKNISEKAKAIVMLDSHPKKGVPGFLLEVIRNTNNMRIRFAALRSLQVMLDDSPENQFDYKSNKMLWEKHKEDFYKKIEDNQEKGEN